MGEIEGTSHVNRATTNLLCFGWWDIAQSSFATSSTGLEYKITPIKKSANFTAAINEYYVVTMMLISRLTQRTKGDGFMVLCIGDNVSIGGDDYYKRRYHMFIILGCWFISTYHFRPERFCCRCAMA
jgi:hypothetical protein